MALCGCFRSNPQVNNENNRGKNRTSIRKTQERDGMDLLAPEGRRGEMSGLSDGDEWFEHKPKNSRDPYHRNSTNAHRMQNSGSN